jgi:serine/threonine-protein kinase RsbW
MNSSPTPPAATRPEATIELVSKPAYLCAVRDFMRAACRRSGLSDDQSAQVVLALDEALANVMKHGYEGRSDGWIRVSLTPFSNSSDARGPGLRIVIEDEAKQVDIASIKSRDLADVRPGGLGVHIIQQVMDSAVYERREGGVGMRLTLVKHLSSPAITGDSAQSTQRTNQPSRGDCCGGSHGS